MTTPFPAAMLVALMVVPMWGCTGATIGSGVGETRFEHAPYYAGARAVAADAVAFTAVACQRGGSHSAHFDPPDEEGSPIAALLGEMNADLASIGGDGSRLWVGPLAGTPPDVQFGCEQDGLDECVLDDEGGLYGPGRARMRPAVGRSSSDWVASASEAMTTAGADALLVITLEVGQYWPRQVNWRGSKALELGTNRSVELPWLTAIDAPVSVIQLTGVLVGADGVALRIGAEGLLARRTSIAMSGFGAQALITDDDVQALRTLAVGDGEGGGRLVWREALRTLVETLTAERLP